MTSSAAAANLPRGVRAAWDPTSPEGKPGPRAAFTITEIADTAVALADAEGVSSLSLGRIAERLGITTNALYRYVDSRDDLDAIVHDHALGAPGPTRRAADWTQSVRTWCRSLRGRYRRHPWLAELQVRIPFAPNALAWLDDLLARLAPSGLSEADALRTAGLLDGYVRSRAVAEHGIVTSRPLDGTAIAELIGDDELRRRLPHVSALVTGGLYREPVTDDELGFEFGLSRILDGLRRYTEHDA